MPGLTAFAMRSAESFVSSTLIGWLAGGVSAAVGCGMVLLKSSQLNSRSAAMKLSRELPVDMGKYPAGKVQFVIDMLPDLREEEVEEKYVDI